MVTDDKKVDFPTSESPSNSTVISGGGMAGSMMIEAYEGSRGIGELQGGFIVWFTFSDLAFEVGRARTGDNSDWPSITPNPRRAKSRTCENLSIGLLASR